MWNSFDKIIHQPSTKTLGLALLASIMLHGFLLGNFKVDLPTLNKDRYRIQATLTLPKPITSKSIEATSTKPSEIKTETKTAPEPSKKVVNKKPKLEPIIKPDIEPILEPQLPQIMAPEPTIAQVDDDLIQENQPEKIEAPAPSVIPSAEITKSDATQIDSAPTEIAQPEIEDTLAPPWTEIAIPETIMQDNKPENAGVMINPQAYRYIETDFAVYTEIGGSAQGKAKIIYKLDDKQKYELKSKIEPTGLAALIISNLLQTSVGTLTKNGLQPINYLYQYGNKADKTYIASFDWQGKKVSLTTVKGNKIENINEGAQDLLSFMYQFMHVAPLQNMQISIATGKKLSTYDYSFEGDENIMTAMGELKTMHIAHTGVNNDEKTELWLAVDHQHVPVKIRKTEKNGKLYELIATAINTTPPAQN